MIKERVFIIPGTQKYSILASKRENSAETRLRIDARVSIANGKNLQIQNFGDNRELFVYEECPKNISALQR